MIKKVKKYFKGLIEIIRKPEMMVLPANLAFYFLMSIIPIISLTFFLFSRFTSSLDKVDSFIKGLFSTNILNIFNPLFVDQSFNGKSLFFIAFAFFIASNGADAIIVASNNVFNTENKPFFKRRLKALFITFVLICLFAFILFVPLFGGQIINMIHASGIKNVIVYSFKVLFPILRIPLSILIIFFLVKLIYKVAPDEKISSSNVNIGAIFTSAMWVVATYVYSLYLQSGIRDTYDIYYGSLSNIVILLLLFFILAYVFVLGLVMNYRYSSREIEKTNSYKFKEIKQKMNKLN